RGRDARRAADRARADDRPGAGADGAADALRRPDAAAARPGRPRPARPLRSSVRAGLVPVPHAPPGRAAGEPPLLPAQRPRVVAPGRKMRQLSPAPPLQAWAQRPRVLLAPSTGRE